MNPILFMIGDWPVHITDVAIGFAAATLGGGDRIVRGLVQAASTLGAADTEPDLATALVRDAVRLTGFARAALVRPQGADRLEILAAHDSTDELTPNFRFSRSLVRMGMQGRGCALTQMPRYTEDSVAELGITGAVCALPTSKATGTLSEARMATIRSRLFNRRPRLASSSSGTGHLINQSRKDSRATFMDSLCSFSSKLIRPDPCATGGMRDDMED